MDDNITLFNQNILLFFKYLKELFKDDKNIKSIITDYIYKATISIRLYPTSLIKNFNNNIYIYHDDILNENEKIIKLIGDILCPDLDLANIWAKIPDKITSWKYLKIFILLCKKEFHSD